MKSSKQIIQQLICILSLVCLASAEEGATKLIHSVVVGGKTVKSLMNYELLTVESDSAENLQVSLDCRNPINSAKRFLEKHQLSTRVLLTEVKLRSVKKDDKTLWYWQLLYAYESEPHSGTGQQRRLPIQVTLDGEVMAEVK